MSPTTASAWSPVISPDGKSVAFVGSETGSTQDIWVVPMEGGAPQAVGIEGAIPGISLHWCGSGRTLIVSQAESIKDHRTLLFDLDTSKTTYLLNSQASFMSSCSPDGKYVVVRLVKGDKLQLFEFRTQQWSDLASHSVGTMPWSTDG